MYVYNAISKKTLHLLLALILGAFGVNALAAAPAGLDRIQAEIQKESAFPKWVPQSSQMVLSDALQASFEEDGENSASYSNLIGRFGHFYMKNAQAFEGICDEALSLAQCKPLIWEKAKEVFADKVHLATGDVVNQLLFLKNNPHLPELMVPRGRVLASMGLQQGKGLKSFLAPHISEFNTGGFKATLFNNNSDYAQVAPLLGAMTPAQMSAFLLDENSQAHFEKKVSKAKTIFELEWRLFAGTVLLPHTLLTSMTRASEKALYLSESLARDRISTIALGMCEKAPAHLAHGPELQSFCKFLYQFN